MNVHSAVAKEYARLAPDYDRRWSRYITATIDETLRRMECRPDEVLLDVGCGTGVLLRRLVEAGSCAVLVGLDPAPKMLHVARNRLGGCASLCAAWAEKIPFGDSTFSALVCTNSLHYFPEPHRALSEFRRVLRPGGRLFLTDWCDDYIACRICDRWLRLTNRAYTRTYRSTQLRCLLNEAGFPHVTIDKYKIDWLWGLMTARAG